MGRAISLGVAGVSRRKKESFPNSFLAAEIACRTAQKTEVAKTSGGSPEQIKYLVQQGCIKPLCDLLTCNDARLVTVALEGIENVLKAGEQEAQQAGSQNPYTTFVDEAEGLDKLEQLQNHNNEDVYKKAMHILETYFGLDDEEDEQLAPEAGQQGFVFAQGGAPMGGAQGGGYSFG